MDNTEEERKYKSYVLDFVMKIVKFSLLEQEYKQVGRLPRFFNAKEAVEIR